MHVNRQRPQRGQGGFNGSHPDYCIKPIPVVRGDTRVDSVTITQGKKKGRSDNVNRFGPSKITYSVIRPASIMARAVRP